VIERHQVSHGAERDQVEPVEQGAPRGVVGHQSLAVEFAGEWTLRNLGGSGFGAALRGSYTWAPANNADEPTVFKSALGDEENLQGTAGGGGLFYDTGSFLIGADYAFKYMGVLGPTHFVSFSLGW